MIKKKSALRIFAVAFIALLFSAAAHGLELQQAEISAVPGETFYIPVSVRSNNGIMGFKFTVEFDPSCVNPVSVQRGTLTQGGMFDDNISNGGYSSFDVVWSSTENVTGDGTLAVIGLKANEGLGKSTAVRIVFSPEDTFDSAYESVSAGAVEYTVVPGDKTDTVKSGGETGAVNDEVIIAAVESAVGQKKVNAVAGDEKEAVLDAVNSEIGKMTGSAKKTFAAFDEMERAYVSAVKKDFAEKVSLSVDSDEFNTVLNDALEKYGVDSVDKIDGKDKKDFVATVVLGLRHNRKDINDISGSLETEDAIEAISEAAEKCEALNSQGRQVQGGKKQTLIISAVAVALALAIVAITIVLIKKKSQKTESKMLQED